MTSEIDIVERLRDAADDHAIRTFTPYAVKDLEDAAAEIERLREELTAAHARASEMRAAAIEECAKVAEQQADEFLSPQYASNQPFGSICERFACEHVAQAIRALAIPSGGGGYDHREAEDTDRSGNGADD